MYYHVLYHYIYIKELSGCPHPVSTYMCLISKENAARLLRLLFDIGLHGCDASSPTTRIIITFLVGHPGLTYWGEIHPTYWFP